MSLPQKLENGQQLTGKPMKFYKNYVRAPISDPNAGYTPIGNMKQYNIANIYERSEPTHLNDLPTLYKVPYKTTPALGTATTSRKNIDVSSQLRSPVHLNRKTANGISQVVTHPPMLRTVQWEKDGVSPSMATYLNSVQTINYNLDVPPVDEDGLTAVRTNNRWDYVDPKLVQNPDHILMNYKTGSGNMVSLHQCGISTRNELRNFVELNNC